MLWDQDSTPANVSFSDDGAANLRLATGAKFRIAAPPRALTGASAPREHVRDAVGVLTALAHSTNSARTDPNLSDIGRRKALAEMHGHSVFSMGQLWRSVQGFKGEIAAREARLFQVDKPNPSDAGAAIRAWESRAYFESLDAVAKKRFVAEIHHGNPQVNEVLAALLNSPYSFANPEVNTIREAWQEARRAQNPTEAEAIDADRDAAAWAEAQITTMAVPVAEMIQSVGAPPPLSLFAKTKASAESLGIEVFGISNRDLSTAQTAAAFNGDAT